MPGLLLLKHIYGLSDGGICERWVYDPYFQYFTGEDFFQHVFRTSVRTSAIGGSGSVTSWSIPSGSLSPARTHYDMPPVG